MKLYIEELKDKERPKTIIKFIKLFLFTNNNYNAKATFTNKECNIKHCVRGKMRSYDDIFILTKTYYPSITHKKLMEILLCIGITEKYYIYDYVKSGNVLKERIRRIYMSNCSTMRRIRITYNQDITYIDYNSIKMINKYNSKYSWIQLLNKLGITSQKELINYMTKNHIDISKI